jgi:hypothetical protein
LAGLGVPPQDKRLLAITIERGNCMSLKHIAQFGIVSAASVLAISMAILIQGSRDVAVNSVGTVTAQNSSRIGATEGETRPGASNTADSSYAVALPAGSIVKR